MSTVFDENTSEYNVIAKAGAKLCNDVLAKLKNNSSNSESAVTFFAGFDETTMIYLSLLKLLNSKQQKSYCVSSLLSLSRSLFELSNTLYFFFIEKVNEEEANFRLLLFNYISKKDRFEIVKKMNTPIDKLKLWSLTENEIKIDKDKIEKSDFYKKLIQEKLITDLNCLFSETNKNNKYYKRYQILKSRNISTEMISWYYKLSSSFLHGSPSLIDRIRQHYINQDYIDYDIQTEVLAIMQVASSLYCCLFIDSLSYFKFENNYLDSTVHELITNYKNVITNGP